MKEYTNEEVKVMKACLEMKEVTGIPMVRIAWSLAPMFDRTVEGVRGKLKQLDEEMTIRAKTVKLKPKDYNLPTGDMIAQAMMEAVEEDDQETGLEVDDIVTAEVRGIVSFGAFCRPDGYDNDLLLHVSKIKRAFVEDIHKELYKGQIITATVINGPDGQLALSMIG